jgi:hypothetical protein
MVKMEWDVDPYPKPFKWFSSKWACFWYGWITATIIIYFLVKILNLPI